MVTIFLSYFPFLFFVGDAKNLIQGFSATGANIYCLDKNYGGVLIIWDRLFGTFAEERQDEEIVYGLVMNQPSFNLLHLQVSFIEI